MKFVHIFIFIISLPVLLVSQNETVDTTLSKEKGWSVYTELGGKHFLIGGDVEYAFDDRNSLSAGVGIFAFGAPTLMYHHLLFPEKHSIELGIGLVAREWAIEMDYGTPDNESDPDPEPGEKPESYMIITGFIGYRYQKVDGLILRIGFTPGIDWNRGFAMLPVGIAVGYTFSQ